MPRVGCGGHIFKLDGQDFHRDISYLESVSLDQCGAVADTGHFRYYFAAVAGEREDTVVVCTAVGDDERIAGREKHDCGERYRFAFLADSPTGVAETSALQRLDIQAFAIHDHRHRTAGNYLFHRFERGVGTDRGRDRVFVKIVIDEVDVEFGVFPDKN